MSSANKPGYSRRSFTVQIDTPQRLDIFVTELMARELGSLALTRSQVKKLIEDGEISFRGKVMKQVSEKVQDAGIFEIPVFEPQALTYEPDASLQVLHEDDAIIVINKPAGLAVHPGAGRTNDTLVNKLLPRLVSNDAIRPGIVHRLDKDTTGVLVVAKTIQAHAALAKQFSDHSIHRRYKALVVTTPRSKRLVMEQEQGVIDKPLSRAGKKIIVDLAGRRAVTHWSVIERMGYGALVEFRLETGRTHQIRVHAASIQCPVVGDRTYGDFSCLPPPLMKLHEAFGRQALHAFTLGFIHPNTNAFVSFSAPEPADFVELARCFREYGAG